jgi:hypothetical protein
VEFKIELRYILPNLVVDNIRHRSGAHPVSPRKLGDSFSSGVALPNLSNLPFRPLRLTVFFPSTNFASGLVFVAFFASSNALRQLGFPTNLRPTPDFVGHLILAIHMVQFKTFRGSTVSAWPVFFEPLFASTRHPLTLILTLLIGVFVWHYRKITIA